MQPDDRVIASARRIGRLARSRRTASGLTQSDMVLAAGISERTVHAIEHGKPTARLSAVIALLDALNMELLARREQRDPSRLTRPHPNDCPTCGLTADPDDLPPGRRSPTP